MVILVVLLILFKYGDLQSTSDCDPGWTYYWEINAYVQAFTTTLSFADASAACQSQGGNLVSIHNQFEEEFIANLIAPDLATTCCFWIGLQLDPTTLAPSWTDGTPVDYTSWTSLAPDALKNPCAYMVQKAGVGTLWDNFYTCDTQIGYICQKPTLKTCTPTPCPLGCYVDSTNRIMDWTYFVSSPALTQEACVAACQGSGFKYAGVEAGTWCACANCLALDTTNKKTDDTDCISYACSGDNTERCGGDWRMYIWDLDCQGEKACEVTTSSSTTTTTTTPCCGTWSSWTVQNSCSDTCGSCGIQTKTRKCLTSSTCPCVGSTTLTEPCNHSPCSYPRNSCCTGKAHITSTAIMCMDVSTTEEEGACTPTKTPSSGTCCPTNGMWSDWIEPTSCSDICGAHGTGTFTRICLTGDSCPCTGDSTKVDRCNPLPCQYPRASCYTGYKAGKNNNNQIVCIPISSTSSDPAISTASCCPTDGLWSPWRAWTTCSDKCGNCGTQTRTRLCGSAQYGCPCTGPMSETESCNQFPCSYPRKACCSPYNPHLLDNNIVCS